MVGIALLTLVVVGCGESGPPRIPVSGSVTFESKPVTEGTVTFLSRKSGAATAAKLNDEGKFEIPEGLPAGDYVVSVAPPFTEEVAGAPVTEPAKEYPNIPQKYRSDTTSDLKATIKEDQQEPFQFKLAP